MAIRTDLLLDGVNDLPIDSAGLMPVGFSDYQHQRDMFSSFPGEWKQFPFNGIGLAKYLKSSSNKELVLKNVARQQLQADGYSTSGVKITYNREGQMLVNTDTLL